MIHLVPVADVDKVWPLLSEGMEQACQKARCSLTPDDIYQSCKADAQLHVAWLDEQIKAGIVTQIHERPDGRMLKVIALCGWEMHRWLPELYTYEWLRSEQIKHVVWEGRKGLEAIPGARVIRQVFEMELTDAG